MSYHGQPCQSLVCAIVAQAVTDYQELDRLGVVSDGKLTGHWPLWKKRDGSIVRRDILGMSSEQEVLSIIEFLKSRNLQSLLDVAGIDFHQSRITKTLRIL